MIDKYLYDSCTKCGGKGIIPASKAWMDNECPTCEGTGREPNEHGKAVLALVKTYLRRY